MRLVSPGVTPAMIATFSFGLRRSQNDYAFAEFLLEVVDQRAQLSALERVGAVRQHLDALHFDGALNGFVETAGRRLHAGLFEFAAQTLQLVFLRRRTWRGVLRSGCSTDGTYLPGQLAPLQSRGGRYRANQAADCLDAANARRYGAFAGQLEEADFAGG